MSGAEGMGVVGLATCEAAGLGAPDAHRGRIGEGEEGHQHQMVVYGTTLTPADEESTTYGGNDRENGGGRPNRPSAR